MEKVKEQINPNTEIPRLTIELPNMEEKIAKLAYYKAESRGFEPGHELEDWLEAEREFTF